MKNQLAILLAVLVLTLLTAGCCPMVGRPAGCGKNCSATAPRHAAMAPAAAPAAVQGERTDVIYSCACGDGCDCKSVSTSPGNCKCGKPMAWGHVVRVEGNQALVCNCAEGCSCKQNAADPAKCACGKPLKQVELSGSGLFFCNCGGSCTCNTLSGEAGQCKCGMELKQR